MKINELKDLLKSKSINLKDFKVSYVIPIIQIEKGKELVESFEIKFKREEVC